MKKTKHYFVMIKILKILRFVIILIIFLLFLFIKVGFKVKFNLLPQDLNVPINYFDYSTQIMQAYGMYGDSKQFKEEKKKILSDFTKIKNLKDVQNKLTNLVKISGGPTSYFDFEKFRERKNSKQNWPTMNLQDNILFVKLPTIICFNEKNDNYAKYYNSVIKFVKENETKIKAVILDLRNNFGGSFKHMLAAISPFVKDGVVLKYVNMRRKYDIMKQTLSHGRIFYGNLIFDDFKIDVPVAVLQNKFTTAQAEHILIALKGQENIKSFGENSKGLTCCNTDFCVNEDLLSLTTHKVTGQNYDEEINKKIEPDVLTDDAEDEARLYLKNLIK